MVAPDPIYSGSHRMDGVLIAGGSDIAKKEENLNSASLIDLAPTILHLLDLPVPTSIDGRVVTEIFRDGSPAQSRGVKHDDESTNEIIRRAARNIVKSGRRI